MNKSLLKELAMRNPTQLADGHRRVSSSATTGVVSSVKELSSDETAILSADDSVIFHRHQLEQEVRNRLMSDPRLNFTSLVVRRVRNGLCLEGVLETNGNEADVSKLVRRICGVPQVMDHLVIHRAHELPRKG